MMLPCGAVWVSQWEKAAQGNPGISGICFGKDIKPIQYQSQHLPLSQAAPGTLTGIQGHSQLLWESHPNIPVAPGNHSLGAAGKQIPGIPN